MREQLTARRKSHGYTLESLAELLGVAANTVWRWENGRATPQPVHRTGLCTALQLTHQQLDTLLNNEASTDQTEPATAEPPTTPPPGPDDLPAAVTTFSERLLRVEPDRETLRRLQRLTGEQREEVLEHLREHWHVLVRADNLLGPRHALEGVATQLAIARGLLPTVRGDLRRQVLRLAAQYAESLSWLHEDAGNMVSAQLWIRQSMEWAAQIDDAPMMSWVLYRLSHQALAEKDPARALGLVEAAAMPPTLPGPMRAALTQQGAQAHAADGNEAACQRAIDLAHDLAATGDPGDASGGHGSFATHPYISVQHGRCLLTLGRTSEALSALRSGIASLAPVYRRDLGIAHAFMATGLLADDEPAGAAQEAHQALDIAQASGSARILNMVQQLDQRLTPYGHLDEVTEFRAQLADT